MAGQNGRLILISVAGLAALLMVTLVAAQSTSTATVEVRVWRNVEDPERLHLSTRPADGRWVTHNTPLDMSDLSDSGRWHQSSIIAIDVEVPAAAAGPEPSQFFGIDDSPRCAAVLALVAGHFAEHVSVTSCQATEGGERSYVRGVIVHRELNAVFLGSWSETDGLISLGWTLTHSHPLYPAQCFDLIRRFGEDHARVDAWSCMARVFVRDIEGDEGDPVLVWDVIGSVRDTTGGSWGFSARVVDGESEPASFAAYGSRRPSPGSAGGIDDTPQCAGLLAFVEEHLAETVSIESCTRQVPSEDSVAGALTHEGIPSYYSGQWSESNGVTVLTWEPFAVYPFYTAHCRSVTLSLLREIESDWLETCNAEARVAFGDDGVEVEWLFTGLLGRGGEVETQWAFEVRWPQGATAYSRLVLVEWPQESSVALASLRSQFHGIDDTPECAAVVAFVAEHFAETTSIASCEGLAHGAGSLRGLLVHRNEPGYFDGAWSEADGITSLNWTVTVTYPNASWQCVVLRQWLAEHTGLPTGTCDFAEATAREIQDGDPVIQWIVKGTLGDNATGERPFAAWAHDGETRPYAFKVHAPAEWEFPPAE